MRGVLIRSLAVLGVGLAILAGILYYASTVDGRPPAVQHIGLTHPAVGEEALALTTTSLEVEFSELVRTDTAEAAFLVQPDLDGTFSWSGPTMTFTPADRLPLETTFRITVEPGVVDESGNRMVEASEPFEFETVGPPTVSATQPEDGSEGVALDASIVITFSTLMDTVSVEDALDIEPAFEVDASWSGLQLTLDPADQLAQGARYSVTLDRTARDDAGNPLAESVSFAFVTARSSLDALLVVPADGTEGTSTTTPIAVILDGAVDPDSADDELLNIEPQVAGEIEVVAPPGAAGLEDPAERVLVFRPSGPLQPSTTYRVTLVAGLRGTDGTSMAEPTSWSFTTGAPLPNLSNQVVFLSDRTGIANLWAMNPDGSAERQLSSELSPVTDYAVAPDGRSFVVGDGAVLVRQDADGSDRSLLTPEDVLEFDPAWAPDGSELAFGRADLQTGAGLGIWTLEAGGGDAVRLELPDELLPDATPAPLGTDQHILRAPRYSPDGGALAYVDTSGWVGVVELFGGRHTRAALAAVGPPVWLRDSTGLLVSALPAGDPPQTEAGVPLQPLDIAARDLSAAELATAAIGSLDRGAVTFDLLDLDSPATRPAAAAEGLLYVAIAGEQAEVSGELRVIDRSTGDEATMLADGGSPVLAATFGVEPETIVAARLGDGIWVVDTATGVGEQLAEDGWQARWLP